MSVLPLSRVVLPGSRLVLPIFSKASRSMLAELPGDRFVTVLRCNAEAGGVHRVGTEVRIVERRDLPDDRVLVRAAGERRLVIEDMISTDPYPVAEVAAAGDLAAAGGRDERLRDEVASRFRRYLAVAAESGLGGTVYVDVARDPVAASYQVASTVRLSSPERQELLELVVTDRLERELKVLEREIALLERMMR